MNADGSGQTRLTDNPTWDSVAQGGRRTDAVSRSSRNATRTMTVYVMNADGSGQTRLTDNPAADFDPSWSAGRKPHRVHRRTVTEILRST